MSAFHVSNFGSCGKDIPRDRDGYAYTTAKEWHAAGTDEWGNRLSHEDAAYMARATRTAIRAADRCVARFRKGR